MRSRPSGQPTANLPAHFVDSLRVLFDILDVDRRGLVSFEQISGRWKNLPKANLPPGFLDCLRRVTPPNGLLSFERFMAGFRLALFDRQNGARLQRVRSEGKLNEAGIKAPTMGVNGLLVEGPRHYKSSRQLNGPHPFAPSQHHVYASALRAMNSSHPSLPTFDRPDSPPAVPLLRLPGPQTPLASTRRPASACAPQIAAVPPTASAVDNYGVMMRGKKSITPQTAHSNTSTNSSGSGTQQSNGHSMVPSTKTTRAPLPPSMNGNYAVVNKVLNGHSQRQNGGSPPTLTHGSRFRPLSLTSSGSGSCSSGMGDIRWRDSSRLSSSNSPPDSLRHYAEELQPQVAKHERLLEEETEVIGRGMDVTRNLLRWYEERVESLQKRRRMLSKGMVALDSAVHEQKLNFHRAQITELNRRMTTLMSTTKRGFPTHENMNAMNGVQTAAVASNGHAPPSTIRSAVPPPASKSRTNGSGDYHEITHHNRPLTQQLLLKQNQKLAEELDAKSHLIDRLQREKQLADVHAATHRMNGLTNELNRTNGPSKVTQRRPAAYVHASAVRNYARLPISVRDTLL